jgi:hypothetical protein
MDDTIGDVHWNFTGEPDFEGIAGRAAVGGASLHVHETYILNEVDVTIVISRLPRSIQVAVFWNERDRAEQIVSLQQEADKLKLYSRIKSILISALVTETE